MVIRKKTLPVYTLYNGMFPLNYDCNGINEKYGFLIEEHSALIDLVNLINCKNNCGRRKLSTTDSGN